MHPDKDPKLRALLERFRKGCAVCGTMNWFVTASGGYSCGNCGNIFDAPLVDEPATEGGARDGE